jgi:hypothetical protein
MHFQRRAQFGEPHGFTTVGFANAADHYARSENTPSAANATARTP